MIYYECNNDLVNADGTETFTYTCASQGDGTYDWEPDIEPGTQCERKYFNVKRNIWLKGYQNGNHVELSEQRLQEISIAKN